MPIQATDIKIQLSGGAANSDPNASLGGAASSVELVNNSLHNLFDKVLGSEADAGDIEYRAVYVKNGHASITLENAKVYIKTQTPSPDTSAQISVATESGSPIQSVANENTAPAGQVFSNAQDAANALALGNLAPGAVKAVWIKWAVNAGAAAYNDTLELEVFGDSNP
jgi:hypothetical protein